MSRKSPSETAQPSKRPHLTLNIRYKATTGLLAKLKAADNATKPEILAQILNILKNNEALETREREFMLPLIDRLSKALVASKLQGCEKDFADFIQWIRRKIYTTSQTGSQTNTKFLAELQKQIFEIVPKESRKLIRENLLQNPGKEQKNRWADFLLSAAEDNLLEVAIAVCVRDIVQQDRLKPSEKVLKAVRDNEYVALLHEPFKRFFQLVSKTIEAPDQDLRKVFGVEDNDYLFTAHSAISTAGNPRTAFKAHGRYANRDVSEPEKFYANLMKEISLNEELEKTAHHLHSLHGQMMEKMKTSGELQKEFIEESGSMIVQTRDTRIAVSTLKFIDQEAFQALIENYGIKILTKKDLSDLEKRSASSKKEAAQDLKQQFAQDTKSSATAAHAQTLYRHQAAGAGTTTTDKKTGSAKKLPNNGRPDRSPTPVPSPAGAKAKTANSKKENDAQHF